MGLKEHGIDGVWNTNGGSRSFMEYPREKRLATGALNELYIYIYIYVYTWSVSSRSSLLSSIGHPPRGIHIRAHTYNAPRAGMLKGRLILSHNTQQRCIIRFRVQQLLNDRLHGPIGGRHRYFLKRGPLLYSLVDPFHESVVQLRRVSSVSPKLGSVEIRYLQRGIINRAQLETGEIIQRTANESTFFNALIRQILYTRGIFKLIVGEIRYYFGGA